MLLVRTLLYLWTISGAALALAPPHPDYMTKDYESVHAMRQRLNITYNYEPVHLTAEHCRYITEEQCRLEDEARGEHLQRHRRKLSNPAIGTFRVLVLLIRFPEHPVDSLPPRSHFEELFNGEGTSAINTVGSIREYLKYNSLSQYNVTFDVQDWVVAEQSEAYYANGTFGKNGALFMQQIFTPELSRLDVQEGGGIDWAPYDADGDKMLDHMVAIHSGHPAEIMVDMRTCGGAAVEDRIWSQAVAGAVPGGWKDTNGEYTLSGYTISSAFTSPLCNENTKGDTPTDMAIVTHEYLHGFGLDDLYDMDMNEGQNTRVAGVGAFDIMAYAYGWQSDGTRPGHVSAWHKIKAGWIEPVEITENGFYSLQSAELAGQVYKISQGYPDGEYLLIENRFAIKWDDDWTGRGLVIYHIDDNKDLQKERGYPGHPNWPTEHYQVAVLQADGNYDIENLVNDGDDTDFWTMGMTLGPGPNWPNTDSYSGTQYETGISITVTTEPSFVMQFEVSGLTRRATEDSSSTTTTGYAPGHAPLRKPSSSQTIEKQQQSRSAQNHQATTSGNPVGGNDTSSASQQQSRSAQKHKTTSGGSPVGGSDASSASQIASVFFVACAALVLLLQHV